MLFDIIVASSTATCLASCPKASQLIRRENSGAASAGSPTSYLRPITSIARVANFHIDLDVWIGSEEFGNYRRNELPRMVVAV